MSQLDLNALITRLETAINTADEKLLNELVDETAPFYTPVSPDPIYGATGFLAVVNLMRASFPDVQWKKEETIVQDHKSAVRWTCSGTHQHEFMGIPTTGKHFSIRVMNFYTFNPQGKIISDIAAEGMIGIVRAIGLLS